MEAHEIPVSQWQQMLNQFSRRHHGQDAHVETAGPDTGLHQHMHGVPLLGVTAEYRGADPQIEVIAGGPDGALISHAIGHPSHIRMREWNDGVSAELEIETQGGYRTCVRVGPSEQVLPPEVITDGLFERD